MRRVFSVGWKGRAACIYSTESGEHEKRTGQRDENWPWYAAYMVAEQAGEELPQ
jgi:hypothetical protein